MIRRPISHRRRWLSLAATALIGGCAPTAPRMIAHPPMWEVRDADTRIILFGSVHQLPVSLDWTSGAVSSAVRAADELWLELSPAQLAGAPALFDQMRQDEPVPPLAQRLSRSEAIIIRRLAQAGGFASDAIDTSESWALAIAAGRGALAGSDFSSENGVESRLIAAIGNRGRPIIGLEGAAAQLDAFDSLAPTVQARMLAATARRAATALPEADRLVAAWARGDAAVLAQIASDGLRDTPELVEPLVHARNRRWAMLLQQRMQRPGTILVAVGTGHLVGEQSLVQLLQRQSLRVRRLDH